MVQAFREFKTIWDPDWKMNPGKVIDARPLDADLRLGPDTYHPLVVHSHFRFPDDQHSFTDATRRCVGIGKCRKEDAGTMCPSYMVTREEQHATRGRAHLLFEMLQHDPVNGGWANEEVHDALDLCLSCKGCKGDCPVQVDMATYKAEFLSHYYEHHQRPRTAYAFGFIRQWASIASYAPSLVNVLTQTPLLNTIAKLIAGMPQARSVPRFAPFTFRQWFLHRRRSREAGDAARGNRVILWPDTFSDHFHPETAIAAVEVLEAAGFGVEIPLAPLCCGRPLYDYGMLPQARHHLEQILEHLAVEIDAGIPIVGLEPSCVSVFRDELVNLLDDDPRAHRLSSQVFSFGEFVSTHVDKLPPLQLGGRALVHGHCHQKALFGMDGDRQLLDRIGLDYEVLDSGCCGMAGSFGFERDHYDVSQAIGERRLLPRVRSASSDTLIIADGFSCREQIRQGTGRRALHLAEVLAHAMHRSRGEGAPQRLSTAVNASGRVSPAPLVAGLALTGAAMLLLRYSGAYRRA
jgi:Fe-S oxidoreductase